MTYEELIERAYGHSLKNQPQEIANESVELLNVSRRIFEALYTIGARIAPYFYGVEADQSDNGSGGWDIPAEADTIFYIEEKQNGGTVAVVPLHDKDAEEGLRVYSIGKAFKPVDPSTGPDPSSTNLLIYHTVAPTDPTALTDDLPAEYPENHYDLPILQLAIYLSRKDLGGRENELQALTGQRNRELARYVSMLENRLPTMRTRFTTPKRVQDQSLVSFREILTGRLQQE